MLEYVIIEARRQPQDKIVLTKRIARNQRIGVGRTDSADLVLNDDPEMSSLHFLVAVSDDACTITDQNSTNKTYYNGKPITQINIGDGERILCGKTEFVFRLVSTFDDASPANPFVFNQPRPETSIEPTPAPASKAESTSTAERSTVIQRSPHAPPDQPPRQRTQPANPEPSITKPSPSVSPFSKNPAPIGQTDSADVINWNLFSEEKSVAEQAGEAEITGDESNETRVISSQPRLGNIVQVVIKIAGNSDASARLVIDPRQNSKVVIGRATSTQLPCPRDSSMSNRHFEIEIKGNQCLIRDLNSSNGTSVNSQRIVAAPLHHGDRVFAGQTEFEIAIEVA